MPPASQKILKINIVSKGILQASYMPYTLYGGLLIPATKPYALNDEILLTISLAWEGISFSVASRVIMISPGSTSKSALVGVHFVNNAAGKEAKNSMENILG